MLGVGIAVGILVTLMGADLVTKALGVTVAATATAMSVCVARYWPFPIIPKGV